MDSLMGVEIKQALERDYDVIASIQEIRGMSIAQLGQIGAGQRVELGSSTNQSIPQGTSAPASQQEEAATQ